MKPHADSKAGSYVIASKELLLVPGLLARAGTCRLCPELGVPVRKSQYLNNIVEQDHWAIKGRCLSMLGFKSYRTAAVTRASNSRIVFASASSSSGPGGIFWSLKN